jgi:hypothetical protein
MKKEQGHVAAYPLWRKLRNIKILVHLRRTVFIDMKL